MKFIGIIPARFNSSRFPGKPLADIGGKSMIQRVYERASFAHTLHKLFVATDDKRIESHVKAFKGNVVMTSPEHHSGTERCSEAIEKMKDIKDEDVVINIQGDEPFIEHSQIDLLAGCFHIPGSISSDGKDVHVRIATLVKEINDVALLYNPNIPKVIINDRHYALYFSRSAIPYCRDIDKKLWTEKHTFYKHIGIYAYRAATLKKIAKLPPAPLELAESLEQLRWLENGFSIKVAITILESTAIDVPSDIERALKIFSHK